jgi:hypothetical protein
MAKYAAEAGLHAIDTAIQTHGGNGFASEYGLADRGAWSGRPDQPRDGPQLRRRALPGLPHPS